jgi:pimeloyl-ACP methyl ester carboxylesterase
MFNKIFLIHDKEEENQTKEMLIRKSGIPHENVKFHNIKFKNDDNDFVHLMLVDDKSVQNKQDLVFIHGLSASSVLYFGIFKEISHKFRIFAIDIPGMGWYDFYLNKLVSKRC